MERRFTRWSFARASLDVDVLAICALFTVAFGLRAWWLFVQQPTQITWDGAEYARAAENVLAGHGYVGLRGGLLYVFPPLYTLTIAAAMPFAHGSEGAGVLISLLSGAALVIPVYATANLVYGRRTALLAGTIAAVLPFAVNLSVLVLADALFLTLASAGLYYTLRTLRDVRPAFAAPAGVAYGLA
jgi:4-amino-4-deoxy-L-arabinose transferase-like glycosyltransferase